MGFVYVAQCNEFYKIGYTEKNPLQRITSLQTGNPYPVRLVGAIPGTFSDEKRLHDFFAGKHVQGEWFALTQG